MAVKLWSMFSRGTDELNYNSIWLFFQTIVNVISDVLFAVILYLQNETLLFSAAAVCTSLSLQMMKTYFEITIFAYDSNVEELFREYLIN